MLNDGVSIELAAKYTGLTYAEIEGLGSGTDEGMN